MMCIAAYKNILNANYFEKGTVDIGRKNFDVIQDFGTGGFWSFWKSACSKAHRAVTLYMYTYLSERSAQRLSSISDINKVKLDIATEIPVTDLVFSNSVLGKGAFGEVRKGVWCYNEVAIKTIDLQHEKPKNIVKEIAILSRIKHKNIVSFMGYSINDREFHIVMEFVNGYSLSDLIFRQYVKSKLPLNDIDRINITYQMLFGITFLHEFPKKVLHRDIKPANIMITKKKIVKICDLGVSTINQLDTQLLTTHGRKSFVGTPMYMAPEVYLRQQEVTEYGDIWSLACTLVEMFSNKHVWPVNVFTTLDSIFKKQLIPDCTDVPVVLKREIEKCFNYNPVMRPKAKEILMVLKNSGIEVEID
uniref:Protein kinase domain-containing protein n=1 Tax=Trichogramma kaykai TaxID=54128 RepID=A0ABD2XG36_9HYME